MKSNLAKWVGTLGHAAQEIPHIRQKDTPRKSRLLVACSMMAVAASASAAYASQIAVNFYASSGGSLATSAIAGISSVAQNNWNDITGASDQSGLSVMDNSANTATGVTLSFTSTGLHNDGGATADQNLVMMSQILVSGSSTVPASATVAGLTYPTYDVYVYFNGTGPGDAMEASIGSTAYYAKSTGTNLTGGGDADFALTTATSASGEPSANYALFTGLTGSSVTINVYGGNAGMSGFQIVETPEPASLAFVGCSATSLLLRRRRARRPLGIS